MARVVGNASLDTQIQDLKVGETRGMQGDKASVTASSPRPFCHLTVKSGYLCYGALHNIWHGANSSPVPGFPFTARPRDTGGTVISHKLSYNVSAKSGTWSVFRLVDVRRDQQKATGWFACHQDIDPEKEIDRILRLSGSPYEEDSGSRFSSEETEAAGVLVVNRYDWGWYDKHSLELFEDGVGKSLATGEAVGMVDRAHAVDEVNRWRPVAEEQRNSSERSVWMNIDPGEYIFGRFAFDTAKEGAQSLLFFSGQTDFRKTTFSGLERTLRLKETSQERFERALREGEYLKYSGLETLRECTRGPSFSSRELRPPRDQLLGPYDESEHIFRVSDIEAMRLYASGTEIAEPLKEHVTDLFNEVILAFLERSVIPNCSCGTTRELAAAIFPGTAKSQWQAARMAPQWLLDPSTGPPVTPRYDGDAVAKSIRAFLTSRCGSSSGGGRASTSSSSGMALNDDAIAGLHRCLANFAIDAMEQTSNRARDCGRHQTTPGDFRVHLWVSGGIWEGVSLSKVYWEGR